mmetsp:Transcript_39142/g.88168  ORF Transcript_39142/g.88168 Transcript_39142/m.88168 type:complete len:449 (-) Transcript_39142:9-1355(-)
MCFSSDPPLPMRNLTDHSGTSTSSCTVSGWVMGWWKYITMSLMTSFACSTALAAPARVTLYFLPAGGFFGASEGMLTDTPISSLIFRITAPCLPIISGKYEGCTATKCSEKSSYSNEQYPFSTSCLMASSAWETSHGDPVTVKISPLVSMRAPVFSWIILILEPLGPMTMPIFDSGTFTCAEEVFGAAGSLSLSAAAAALTAAMAGIALTDCVTPVDVLEPPAVVAGPIPGMYWMVCPGLTPAAFASAFSCSIRSLRLCCFVDRPVDTAQSPPVPSSSSKTRSGLGSRFRGSSSTGAALAGAFALAAGLALASAFGFAASGLAAGFSAGFAAVFALGSALGSAFGSALGSALAFPFAFALGSAGAAAGFASAFGFLVSLAGGSGALGGAAASASPSSLAFLAAALRFALLERPSPGAACALSAMVLILCPAPPEEPSGLNVLNLSPMA